MKRGMVFFALTVLALSFAEADVISINSGGSEKIVINSDNYIEGFFSCVPTTCVKLGYACGDWSDGCAKTINCGSCSDGYTCSSGVCTGTGTGGGGGGGGGGAGAEVAGIVITPTSINLTLSFNNQTNMSQRTTQKIYIKNNGNSEVTLSVSQTGLGSVAILSVSSITVSPGETTELQIDFISPLEEQDLSGTIIIDGKIIPVYLHVTANPLWFDSNIVVLNDNYQVSRGGTLNTRVELVPMGEESRLDVTLNYVIKDTSGKIYLTKSETVLVEDRTSFDRDFGTGMLPVGSYIIGLEVVYPGGIAPSSAHFEVVKMNAGNLIGTILFFIILGILILAIFIVIVLIRRKRKEKEEQSLSGT